MTVLSAGQQTAFDKIMRWHAGDEQTFVLAGYAGTGKSTLANMIASEIGDRVYFCAYTGKAANVLREKGCENAKTIHGWLYSPKEHNDIELNKLKEELEDARNNGREADIAILEDQIKKLIEAQKKPKFVMDEDSELLRANLVIVDEFSMLNEKIIDDLKKVSKKILFLGDPYQLPPVEGENKLEPDFFLDEIHRQALDSAIIRYSKIVREGGHVPFGDHGDLKFFKRLEISEQTFLEADQVICGRNDTRKDMNAWFRKKLGYLDKYPMKGEKLICLKNNHMRGIFNGMIAYAEQDAKYSGIFCHLNIQEMNDIPPLDSFKAFSGDFTGDEQYDFKNFVHREYQRFTYGYVITCHKSQGSEFNNLVVINEMLGKNEDRRRWQYTAITRAKKQCILVQPS